ncbi:hypothetical protein TNCV_127401 [Trichonephila clavipes]|nr:hypothetical protein TNCV_127401 [Trichonephila clavipes]
MPMDFVRIASEGMPKCQPNSSVWNAGATARALTSPCIDEPATVSISSLTVSAAFRRVHEGWLKLSFPIKWSLLSSVQYNKVSQTVGRTPPGGVCEHMEESKIKHLK